MIASKRAQSLDEHSSYIEARVNAILRRHGGVCLWDDEYAIDTPETALKFITKECYTYDPTQPVQSKVPLLPQVEAITYAWWEVRKNGEPLIIKKSRRVVISWTLRALELWAGGLNVGTYYMACQNYDDSALMLWRYDYIYSRIREERPSWRLPDAQRWLFRGSNALTKFELPNGTIYESLTGSDPNSFRQEGATCVVLEEGAHFDRIAECFSNAKIMCQGRDGRNGFLVLVSTASSNPQWRKLSERDMTD